jgi:hypothetical protein
LAEGNYPFSKPASWVISKPIPWSPHFKYGAPICIGTIWSQSGSTLLGHLLKHIAKLLNFDEVARGGGYVGWNGQATRFWKKELNEQPITPGLTYPSLPTDRTHGVKHTTTTPGLFRPGGQMRPDPSSGPGTLFRPK